MDSKEIHGIIDHLGGSVIVFIFAINFFKYLRKLLEYWSIK